ncbi:arf-GAP with coiled-coil, ANK repeat and PH domain-containing protein 2 [Anthonomus grandis grandis]|uniref:arf-GAP with coiled-coil, ANK repeat and PH domain-containing protein 2 n=1 Tax=Anthonomus grandis grandis TaxID=2921223 RepID=UPI00216560A6|nr:arf-GAP with coiled-coil, ANK repeat and PH domain-containing protein 2 [Anthonomus grandis grandis]
MEAKIEPLECLRDSPKFRTLLEEEEQSIEQLEHRLEKILKISSTMIEAGKTYVGQQSLFANSLWDLSLHFKEDPDVLSALNKLIHSLQEMNKFHTTLLDQASRSIVKNISTFIKSDIKAVKDYKHHFEKYSNDYDNILLRNSHISKNKPQEVEEVQNVLVAVRSCFGHQALNYVNSIYVLQAKKRHEILSTLLSYMHACTAYFHQGEDLCEDLQPFFKRLANEISNMSYETRKIEKEVENSHSLVSQPESQPISVSNDRKSPKLEGYLFKRTSNAFKTWNRRWFYLYDNRLVYRKRSGDDADTVMEEDLRLCTVKPVTEGERRFCFEIVSPSKSHMLQADSEEMYHLWIETLQKCIGAAIQRVQSIDSQEKSSEENQYLNSTGLNQSVNNNKKVQKIRIWEKIIKIPGNNFCADCKSPNPRWASRNLGITLCIECSGVHRSLGVHYSKVRSLTLDDWEPEAVKVMAELGNDVVNKIYEANVPEGFQRASENCTGIVREEWIKSKYVDKAFVRKLSQFEAEQGSSENPTELKKWTVKKIRRSCRYTNKKAVKKEQLKENLDEKEKDEMELPGENSSEKNEEVGSDILLFGNDLDEETVSTIDLSDQESTEGDENGYAGVEEIENLDFDLLLYKAAAVHNLPVMCQAYALGANINWTNPKDKDRTPLHAAVLSGSVMACAYLLLNGSKINAQDKCGHTPLHLATEEGHTAQVCLFLKYKADQHLEDENGKVPLAMAETKEHADIVTLLRLGRLNEEMTNAESGISGDDMFNDVVRDFSRMAPEKLLRSKTFNE